MSFVKKITITELEAPWGTRSVDVYIKTETPDEGYYQAYVSIPDACSITGIPAGSIGTAIPGDLKVRVPEFVSLQRHGTGKRKLFLDLGGLRACILQRLKHTKDPWCDSNLVDTTMERLAGSIKTEIGKDNDFAFLELFPAHRRRIKQVAPQTEDKAPLDSPARQPEPPSWMHHLHKFIVEREALLRYQFSDSYKQACKQMVQQRVPEIEAEIRQHTESRKRALEPEIESYRNNEMRKIDEEVKKCAESRKRALGPEIEIYRNIEMRKIDEEMRGYKRRRSEEIDAQLIRDKVVSTKPNGFDISSLIGSVLK